MRPNLLLVGFQKCGSSTLFDVLCQHTDVTGTSPKETFTLTDRGYPHFRKDQAWANGFRDWTTYLSPKAGKTKYRLEGSVCNFYQKNALRYANQNSDAKVLFILRDPIRRFVSTYHYYGGNGLFLKPGTSLKQYYEMCLKREHNHEAMNFALEHGRYSMYIALWKEQLGDERVHLVGLRQLTKCPSLTLEKLWSFLQLNNPGNLGLPHRNQSTIPCYPFINRFLVKIFRGKSFLPNSIKKIYKKIMYKQVQKELLDEPLRAELKEYYRNEYEQLGVYF